jgi:hypothetical protein
MLLPNSRAWKTPQKPDCSSAKPIRLAGAVPFQSRHGIEVLAKSSQKVFLPSSQAIFTKPLPGFTIPLLCFFPVCLVGTLEIPGGATKGVK